MTISTHLQKFLQKRHLAYPDKRPLYQYKIEPEEITQLQQIWRDTPWDHFPEVWAGIFCLLGATHFCTSYQSGPWSWAQITEPLGIQIPLSSLYSIVEQGLRFWKRPLLTNQTGREFLLTLVCEGGLPLGVLTNPEREQHLSRYLRLLLEAIEYHGSFRAEEMARHYQEVLPPSLQQEVVRRLCIDLLREISELRSRVRNNPHPIQYLDQNFPEWRDQLPISVSDKVTQRLVEGLVKHTIPISAPTFLLEITPELVLTTQSAHLRRNIRWAQEISKEKLMGFLGLSTDIFPSRLYLSFLLQTGRKVRAATAILKGDTYRVQLESTLSLPGTGTVQLLAAAPGKELAILTPPGGELPEDLPWVFRALPATSFDLVGVGAVKTQAQAVYVALPSNWHAGSTSNPQPELPLLQDRRLLYISESTTLVDPDDQPFQLKLGTPDEPPHYMLRGRFWSQNSGSQVCLGLPNIWKILGASIQRVPENTLWWKPNHGRWSSLRVGNTPLGDGWLAVREANGQEVFRTKLRILPANFTLNTVPSQNQSCGTIEASGRGVMSLGLHGPQQIVCTKPDSNPRKIHLETTLDNIPAYVHLEVLFQDGSTARLDTPFPESSARFVQGNGTLQDSQVPVAIRRLSNVSVRATGAMASSRLMLKGMLKGQLLGNTGWHDLGMLSSVHDGLSQLHLDNLSDKLQLWLASTTNLDAKIELRLEKAFGEIGTLATAQICRYEGNLSPVRMQPPSLLNMQKSGEIPPAPPSGEISPVIAVELKPELLEALGTETVTKLRIEARRMEQPDEPPIELPSSRPGYWKIPDEMEPGPWMLLARIGEATRLRPLCVNLRLSEAKAPSSGLDAAVRLPDRNERTHAFNSILEQLAVGYDAQDWPILKQFLASIRDVPAASYEVIIALHRHPKVAAMALMRASSESLPILFRSLEELPFAWFLVSQKIWEEAAEKALAWIGRSFSPISTEQQRALFFDLCSPFFEHVGKLSSPVGVLAEKIKILFGSFREEECQWIGPHRIGNHMQSLRDALENTVTGNLEETWPDIDVDTIAEQYNIDLYRIHETLPRIKRHQSQYQPVLLAPFLAVELVLSNVVISPEIVTQLRWLRAFDTTWFDNAAASYQAIRQTS